MKNLVKKAIFAFCLFLCEFSFLNAHALELDNGIVYSVLEDGTIQIDDYTGTATNLEIPSTIDGKTVTVIGKYAFTSNKTIQQVSLPDTVKEIDYAAFADATNLQKINLGNGLESIGTYAFQNVALTSILLPDSLTTIENYAFYGVTTLEELRIPKNVQTIKSNPAYSTTVKRFTVDSQNTFFAVQDGILFSKDMTSLVGYPPGKTDREYVIPSSVTSLGDYAFSTAKNLQKITVPNNVTTLGEGAFSKTGITNITLPESITNIGFFQFYNCENLEEVTVNSNLNMTGYEMFQSCPVLKKVTFNGTINKTNSRTFHNCPKLTDVIFHADVAELGDYTFYECPSITNIDLPDSVKSIGSKFVYDSNENVTYKIPGTLTPLSDGSYKLIYQVDLLNNVYQYDKANEVVQLVNEQRESAGVQSLTVDKELSEAAMTRARELALLFEHERPTGESISTVSDKVVGENIAAGQSTASGAMNSWMNSSGHRANILNSSYQSIGVGSFHQNGITYWVQLFSDQISSNASVETGTKTTSTEQESISYDNIAGIVVNYNSDYWFQGEYVFNAGVEYKVEHAGIQNAGWLNINAEVNPNNFTYTSSDTNIFEVDKNGTVIGKNPGTATLTAEFSNQKKEFDIRIVPKSDGNIVYKSYINGKGWEKDFIEEGKTSGTTGEGRQLEAFEMYLTNREYYGEIWYRSKSSDSDWESDWRESGEISGKVGSKLEAIQIRLFSNVSLYYDVIYRVYVQKLGWLGWARNGESAGTSGYDYRIEAIEVKLVKKNTYIPSGEESYLEKEPEPMKVTYQTQVQQKGWLEEVSDGATSGTTGSGLRMETLKITLENQEYEGDIEYRSHIQRKGWETEWKKNGEESGTVGAGLRLEAIQIRLTGEMAKHYDIYYRIHSQRFGWLDWTKNGEMAGTEGFGYRVEAVEIKLVKKGEAAPGSTTRSYVSFLNTNIMYQTQVQQKGWLDPVKTNQISGTTGSGLRMESMKLWIDSKEISGSIEYKSHVQRSGWESEWKSNGEISGTVGAGLRLEAIQIRLTGEIADHYDIYYRVHSQRFGWLDWAVNGEMAGTSGYGYRVEAIQIQLVKKYEPAPFETENHYQSVT